MQKGETWRFTYSMYIPSSLKATSSFTHIAHMKDPSGEGDEAAPRHAASLTTHDSNETIEAQVTTNSQFLGSTPLGPLHDKWTDVELEYYVDASRDHAKLTLNLTLRLFFRLKKQTSKHSLRTV